MSNGAFNNNRFLQLPTNHAVLHPGAQRAQNRIERATALAAAAAAARSAAARRGHQTRINKQALRDAAEAHRERARLNAPIVRARLTATFLAWKTGWIAIQSRALTHGSADPDDIARAGALLEAIAQALALPVDSHTDATKAAYHDYQDRIRLLQGCFETRGETPTQRATRLADQEERFREQRARNSFAPPVQAGFANAAIDEDHWRF